TPVVPAYRRYVVWSTLAILSPILLASFVVGMLAMQPDDVPWGSFAGLAAALRGFVGATPLMVLGGLAVIALLLILYRRADARHRGWALREHDLAERHGILWRNVIILPFARIQHVETSHGPIERALDLARLKLYTAGGMTADLTVLGMDRDTADRVREHLVEQIRLRDRHAEGAAGEPHGDSNGDSNGDSRSETCDASADGDEPTR
ncbi:MAG: PH domain-containing protein, partial [Wenzhouxiangellaceae bacterium]|nr:PH domain-containing protein [Wenzhouxiangellaceae bacterium]